MTIKKKQSLESVDLKDLGLDIISDINKGDKNDCSSFCPIKEGDLKRTFSVWSILGIGFGLTNSWWGVSAGLVAGINSGGPMMIVYGVIIIAIVSTCVGITLSEMTSAIPSAGGQYVWTRVLSPKKYSGFLAYLCGSFAWAGAEFMSASITLSIAEEIMAFWVLKHPDFQIKKWHNFVIFQLMNIFLFVFNCHGRFLPTFAKAAIYVSIFSFIVTGVTVVVCSKGHYQSARSVFADFKNNTGWSNSGIAFIVGLINPNWSFGCLDCATHLAEEVYNPSRDVPIAIMGTVAIGFVTAFCYCIAMFFSIQNFTDILESKTGYPLFDIYYQALSSNSGTICLGMLVLLTAVFCMISCHTWQARLCWSFSRDNGFPFSKYLSLIHPITGVPLNAHIFSCFWVAILGCLYMISDAAFNSMVTGSITFMYLSYAVPTLCLLYRGREKIRHGPFWMGRIGLIANIVTCTWTLFALVFYSLPSYMPVTGGNMNYVCVVIVIYFIWTLLYWWVPVQGSSCRDNFAGGKSINEKDEFADVCIEEL